LSGQIPREQGGGSLINLDDSKSVCSCSCQCRGCLPWLPLSIGGSNGGAGGSVSKNRQVASDYGFAASRGTTALSGFTRSYGALSSAATYSAASLGCDNEMYREQSVSERDNQVSAAS
jgi:hypothetical protein